METKKEIILGIKKKKLVKKSFKKTRDIERRRKKKNVYRRNIKTNDRKDFFLKKHKKNYAYRYGKEIRIKRER